MGGGVLCELLMALLMPIFLASVAQPAEMADANLRVVSDTGQPEVEAAPTPYVVHADSDTSLGYSSRRSRLYRPEYRGRQDDDDDNDDDDDDDDDDHDGSNYRDYQDDHDGDDQSDMKALGQPKVDYWGGYYDFLINEGSYKFWAVFQLATAALLIYSGFAALYYAKVNPPTSEDEFDDIFRRRRKRSFVTPPKDRPFSGLDPATFQRIVDAIPLPEVH